MTADRNKALRLADAARIAELEQALDRLQGNYLIAFERGRIAGIAELELQPAFAQLASDLAEKLAATEAERDQLRAEVERLRADAERYQWLADCENFYEAICLIANPSLTAHDLGAAIDHARTTHKDEG